MNWLDNYIKKNKSGYLMNQYGGLFVEVDGIYVRHVKGDKDHASLMEISKDSFLDKLIN